MKKEITKYYNDLASGYDEDRFSNTYGKYIHQQEYRILEKYLDKNEGSKNLDVACGTGRFLDFADNGVDISSEMVAFSSDKFPNKNIQIGDAEDLPFENDSFQNGYSFHLFMHLDLPQTGRILSEVSRVLQKGGYFIFDIPSQKRRNFTNHKTNGWHAANQADVATILNISKEKWELVAYHGIAFFPIHRIPYKWRRYFIQLDNYLSQSFLKEYSSHLIFVMKKK